ncbi:MAG: histidinol-phosphate transaminase [Kordiimonas sp.]|nr:histidinol-phosphate transaminase [Kordiimonas sp.]|tara:strand:- start:415 stop:1506 length:1092 start_codon:yes stop_codon:yes gene_type:complete
MQGPTPRPWIDTLGIYQGGKSKIAGIDRAIKLSSNESALGPSPKAMAAYREEATQLHRYPDPIYHDLRAALAQKYDLDPGRIVCGLGSDEILKNLCRAYAAPSDEVIYSRYGFMMYPIAAQAVGAVPVEADDDNFVAHVDSLLAAVTDKTRIVFLANPNNPTGTYLSAQELDRLHAGLPTNVILVIDSAYAEYVNFDDYDAGLELVAKAPNVVMTRTFSKLYGLGSLRIGWGYAQSEIAAVLDKIRDPFNVSGPAQKAAIAALQDHEFEEKALAHNSYWRRWLSDELTALGLTVIPSAANFVLVRFADTTISAEQANNYLMQKGYILRWLPGQGLADCLRMTVGLQEENEAVIGHLKELMQGA